MLLNMYQEKNNFDKFRSLLEDYNQEHGINHSFIQLSETQNKAFEMFKLGKNILVIGTAGTGKSALLKEIRYYTNSQLGNKQLIITATTGIAAYNIGGITLNSFMGIGTGDGDIEYLYKRIRTKSSVKERIITTDILVIDEISMLSAELFEKINMLCQKLRKSTRLFGGIQLVLTGDFYQLLPVFNKKSTLYTENIDTRLLFESELFTLHFNKKNKNIINLTTNFRQTDKKFIELLNRMRIGAYTQDDINLLNSKIIKKEDETSILQKCVYLVSSNKRAQVINISNLDKLNHPPIKYQSQFVETGNKEYSNELYKELYTQFNQKGIIEVVLKKNARVMLIKNINVEEGLVNGSVGTVMYFENNMPFVKFDNGIQRLITPLDWELQFDDATCKATQIPLMLCWAITHHKSQSLTLECAVLELEQCFCDHQVFVALSRLRSLNGLYIKTFNPQKITINKKVQGYMKNL